MTMRGSAKSESSLLIKIRISSVLCRKPGSQQRSRRKRRPAAAPSIANGPRSTLPVVLVRVFRALSLFLSLFLSPYACPRQRYSPTCCHPANSDSSFAHKVCFLGALAIGVDLPPSTAFACEQLLLLALNITNFSQLLLDATTGTKLLSPSLLLLVTSPSC